MHAVVKLSAINLFPKWLGATARMIATASNVDNNDIFSNELRGKLLNASMKHVNSFGWTEEAVVQGAVDIDLPGHDQKILGRGPIELVEFFLERKRQDVRTRMESEKLAPNPMYCSLQTEKAKHLHAAICHHISILAPFLASWPSAIAILAEPQNLQTSSELAFRVADDLCEYAHLNSTKLDWYKDRATVLSIYGTTELYLLQDNSCDHADTRDYLYRILLGYENSSHESSMTNQLMSCIFSSFQAAKSRNYLDLHRNALPRLLEIADVVYGNYS